MGLELSPSLVPLPEGLLSCSQSLPGASLGSGQRMKKDRMATLPLNRISGGTQKGDLSGILPDPLGSADFLQSLQGVEVLFRCREERQEICVPTLVVTYSCVALGISLSELQFLHL